MRQHPDLIAAYKAAKRHDGLKEIPGPQHSQAIIDWFKAVGHGWVKDDETAWCAAFVGAMLADAGVEGTGALNARSYLEWGVPVDLSDARPGDVVIFWRGSPDSWMGHVGFYVSHGKEKIMVLGGNQGDAVNIRPYSVSRLLGVRTLVADEAGQC